MVRSKVGKDLDSTARLGPADFKPFDFRSRPDPEDFARVMSGEITSPANLQPRTFQVSRLPCNPCTNTIGIRLFAHQAESQPMILFGRPILEQQWRTSIHGDENIHTAIVVIIPDRQPPSRESLRKNRSRNIADVPHGTSFVMEEQKRLLVTDVVGMFFNFVVRMAIGDK